MTDNPPSTDIVIRAFVDTDSVPVWGLHNRALEGTGAHAGNGAWDQDVRDPHKFYSNCNGVFLVGERAGRISAMGAYIPKGDGVVEIKRMRVDPAYQGRGLGGRILEALERRAKAAGFTLAVVETLERQKTAQRLYERSGYINIGVSTMGDFEIIHYEKDLADISR
ncbi:MAG: GNAT family N-acetyltransferase [Pseudomonadota bacterium]